MAPSSDDDFDVVVADVLEWLARPDNVDWLLVFDNVDQDHEQGGTTGAYDVRKYLTADHGVDHHTADAAGAARRCGAAKKG